MSSTPLPPAVPRPRSPKALRAALLIFDFVVLTCPLVYLPLSSPTSPLALYYVLAASAAVVATLFVLWFATANEIKGG